MFNRAMIGKLTTLLIGLTHIYNACITYPYILLFPKVSLSTPSRNGRRCSFTIITVINFLTKTYKEWLISFQLASFSSVRFAVVSVGLGLFSLEMSSVCSETTPASLAGGSTLPF